MTTSENRDDRLDRLRSEWPVESMVDGVMARVNELAPRPRRKPRRTKILASLALSAMIASLALGWILLFSRPQSLLASVQHDLRQAKHAHIVITHWDKKDETQRAEIWYARGKGLSVTHGDEIIVEDGKTQWTWSTKPGDGERIVLRQDSPGFFTTQLPSMLALPENAGEFAKTKAPEHDRVVNGVECHGFFLTLDESKVRRRAPGQSVIRALVLVEKSGRIHEITLQEQVKTGVWKNTRKIEIDHEALAAEDKVAADLPAGYRVIDRAKAFHEKYPIEKAITKTEMGGLILAVHDVQPLKDREGMYVVSSVRGTAEFLKAYPPRVRPLNPEVVLLDVAFQPGSNMTQGSNYHRVVLGSLSRDGIDYSWWMVLPRRRFVMKEGKRVYEPVGTAWTTPGEPGRLDDLPGKARIPLTATYWDEKHRDAKGTQQTVSTWEEAPVPADRPATTLETVSARARRDVRQMGGSGTGGLLGVAADLKEAPMTLRPLSRVTPETTDEEFAAAVRRGLEDLRGFDKIEDSRPGEMPPGAVEKK